MRITKYCCHKIIWAYNMNILGYLIKYINLTVKSNVYILIV